VTPEHLIRSAMVCGLVGEPVQGPAGTAFNNGARCAFYEVARVLASSPDEERHLRRVIDEQQIRVLGRGAEVTRA
jgi:hypothetical protein